MTMTKNTVRVRTTASLCRAYTRDAAPGSRDAILSAIPLGSREEREFNSRTGPIIGFNPGMVWDGSWRSRLDDMSPAAAVVAVADRMAKLGRSAGRDAARQIGDLADYLTGRNQLGSSEATAGPSGSLAFSGSIDEDVSANATPDDLNKANDKFWADRLSRPRTQDGAGRGVSTRATPESINAANASFWANQPTHCFGREYGKG
jgi:hypothetical protein